MTNFSTECKSSFSPKCCEACTPCTSLWVSVLLPIILHLSRWKPPIFVQNIPRQIHFHCSFHFPRFFFLLFSNLILLALMWARNWNFTFFQLVKIWIVFMFVTTHCKQGCVYIVGFISIVWKCFCHAATNLLQKWHDWSTLFWRLGGICWFGQESEVSWRGSIVTTGSCLQLVEPPRTWKQRKWDDGPTSLDWHTIQRMTWKNGCC